MGTDDKCILAERFHIPHHTSFESASAHLQQLGGLTIPPDVKANLLLLFSAGIQANIAVDAVSNEPLQHVPNRERTDGWPERHAATVAVAVEAWKLYNDTHDHTSVEVCAVCLEITVTYYKDIWPTLQILTNLPDTAGC